MSDLPYTIFPTPCFLHKNLKTNCSCSFKCLKDVERGIIRSVAYGRSGGCFASRLQMPWKVVIFFSDLHFKCLHQFKYPKLLIWNDHLRAPEFASGVLRRWTPWGTSYQNTWKCLQWKDESLEDISLFNEKNRPEVRAALFFMVLNHHIPKHEAHGKWFCDLNRPQKGFESSKCSVD